MGQHYDALRAHVEEIQNVNRAGGLLGWDQQVNMPPGGAGIRARQMATLARIGHEMLTGAETARLLDAAEAETAALPYDSDEASMVRVIRQDYIENTKLPSSYVAEVAQVTGEAHEVWVHARASSHFATFQPMLTRIMELMKRGADYIGYADHPYDAMLGGYERGLTTRQVRDIFDGHKPRLVALISAVRQNADRVSDAILHQHYDIEKQRHFGLDVATQLGYDMQRGHAAEAVHPFMSAIGRGDARITTRFDSEWLNPALFGTMHEAGHAMYEQGVAEALDGTPLGTGTSLGVHESQSRMWENIVGRSREFWHWAFPRLQALFPTQLAGVDEESFYRAINKVAPSFIRVEADEATYNLHIMLRFELEMGLLKGDIQPADLAEEWNERFEAFFGITPPDDRTGVLQDIHWSAGLVGYFPTYALGNLLAAQYYEKALAAHPTLPNEIAVGKFDTLLGWLNRNIHVHGRKFTSDELTRRVTGEAIQSNSYVTYLERKYGDIYGL
jgi:carboxypeptidase Taq